MPRSDDQDPINRADFLRLAALGAGGLGLGAAAGCGPRDQPAGDASEGARRGYVVAVTHGPDDPARVLLALFTATRLPRGDNHVWFAIDGGQVCKRDVAERLSSPLFTAQGSAAALIDRIRSQGTALHI